MNIYMPHAINRAIVMAIGRQHEAKSSMEIWKQIEFSKTEEDPVREQTNISN
jgi:hypothetical protein